MRKFSKTGLKDFLEERVEMHNCRNFIPTDPIQIPHAFSKKEDIEIAGFLTASISWGQRFVIIKNAKWLMEQMKQQPYDFLMNAGSSDFKAFSCFKHRTFNGDDCIYFLKALQNIYRNHQGLQHVFLCGFRKGKGIKGALAYFRKVFFELEHPHRTGKHVANVEKNSSAKRLNMFLRWMVRNDSKGVDFGLWEKISPAELYMPLDVHTGRVSRELGLLQRKYNNWLAVEELTRCLREYDPHDPVKYDYALFGDGVTNGFNSCSKNG